MEEEEPKSPEFWPKTRWTLAQLAKQDDHAFAKQCEIYRPIVKKYLEQRMGKSEQDAEDITQEFFATAIENELLQRAEQGKGKLRSWIIKLLKGKCRDIYQKENAEKRGGGAQHQELGEVDEKRGLPSDDPAQDLQWSRDWAQGMMKQAFSQLRNAYETRGDLAGRKFELLCPAIGLDGGSVDRAKVAEELGITEGAVGAEVSRLRSRFREELIQVCIPTILDLRGVDDPEVAYKMAREEWKELISLFEKKRSH